MDGRLHLGQGKDSGKIAMGKPTGGIVPFNRLEKKRLAPPNYNTPSV